MMFTEEELELARCADEDPDIFFSDDSTREGRATVKLAKQICSSCVIKGICLEVAKAENLEGVWGGQTLRERQGFGRSNIKRTHILLPASKAAFRINNAQRVVAAADKSIAYLSLALANLADKLPAETIEMINIRINNPNISLEEIGKRMTNPMSKHSVAGRLRRVVDGVKESINE
jgi:hypothetical protein